MTDKKLTPQQLFEMLQGKEKEVIDIEKTISKEEMATLDLDKLLAMMNKLVQKTKDKKGFYNGFVTGVIVTTRYILKDLKEG